MKASPCWAIWLIPDQRHEMLYGDHARAFTPAQRAQNAILRVAKQKQEESHYGDLFKA